MKVKIILVHSPRSIGFISYATCDQKIISRWATAVGSNFRQEFLTIYCYFVVNQCFKCLYEIGYEIGQYFSYEISKFWHGFCSKIRHARVLHLKHKVLPKCIWKWEDQASILTRFLVSLLTNLDTYVKQLNTTIVASTSFVLMEG